jgi:hypothetical protein
MNNSPTNHLNQVHLARRWNLSPRTLERWRWLNQGPRYWTCPYQTGHLAWLDNLLAMNSRGERMRKPECGWMLL